MRQLSTQDADFDSQLTELLAFETVNDADLLKTVDDIIAQVRADGDSVVLALTQQFDQHPATTMESLELSKEVLAEAFENLDDDVREALTTAATRVQTFHERQVQETWQYEDELGNRLGQKVTPLDRVGIYVPGGLASYPSSVLMNAILSSALESTLNQLTQQATVTSTLYSSASPSSSPVLSSSKPASTSNPEKLSSAPVTITKTAVATEVYESRDNGEIVSVSIDSKHLPTSNAAAAAPTADNAPAHENGLYVVTVTQFATTTTYVTRAPRTTAVTVFNENVVTQVIVRTEWTQNTPVTVYARPTAAVKAATGNGASAAAEPNTGTGSGGTTPSYVKRYMEKAKDLVKRMF